MKKTFTGILAILSVLFFTSISFAGGCGGLQGDCYAPGFPDTGYLGTSVYRWGYGYFNNGDINTLTINTALNEPAGGVTATEIANVTREIYLPMAGWAIDGGDDIDENTAPDIGDDDNIPSITWDDSGETGAIQQTFRLPSTWVSGTALTFYALISSDTDAGAAVKLDWQIWVNTDGTVFDAGAIAQTVVSAAADASPDTKNEVLTLTLDATGIAALTAGDWITLDLFNATTHASANLELKGAHGVYTATQ